MIIQNIDDKIDFENIMKEAYKSYMKKMRKSGENTKAIRYNISKINVFLERMKNTYIILFKQEE